METITLQAIMVMETCLTCGIHFAVPDDYVRGLREKHRTFYCPNGHPMYYPSETEEEKLRRQLRKSEELRKDYQEENTKLTNQLNGALDKMVKIKKRANAGICPHCHRHFMNVERHIKTKHKDKL